MPPVDRCSPRCESRPVAQAREHREAERAARPGAERRQSTAPTPLAARVLALQATAGNRAVGRLLARTPRDDLADKLRREYGIGTIRAGTVADQVADLAAHNGV